MHRWSIAAGAFIVVAIVVIVLMSTASRSSACALGDKKREYVTTNDYKYRERLSRLRHLTRVRAPTSLIQHICYINMERSADRNILIQGEIEKMGFPTSTTVERLEGVPVPGNGAKGCYLSHLNVLAHIVQDKLGHTLVLEDDFVFNTSRDELEQYLKQADSVCGGRWDVIILGQDVFEWQPIDLSTDFKIFRALRSTTTSGYIVNKNYAERLLTLWHEDFVPIQNKTSFDHDDNLDQLHVAYQQADMWIAFDKALGVQRPGLSEIGNNMCDNYWSTDSTYSVRYGDRDRDHSNPLPLILHPPAKLDFSSRPYAI